MVVILIPRCSSFDCGCTDHEIFTIRIARVVKKSDNDCVKMKDDELPPDVGDVSDEPSGDERLGAEIRRLREAAGWTQKDLAYRLQSGTAFSSATNQATISRIEKGIRAVTFLEARDLASIFGRGVESLVEPNQYLSDIQQAENLRYELQEAIWAVERAVDSLDKARQSARLSLARLREVDRSALNSFDANRLNEAISDLEHGLRSAEKTTASATSDGHGSAS
jgi:transcriptional regulator with XRE-family HTH domain